MSYSIDNYSKKFNDVNKHVRAHWQLGREEARQVAIHINKLVNILHKEHNDWSINKIAHAIWAANEDLEGFSRKTIYNNLNDENRILIDTRFQKGKNNVLEESDVMLHPNVIEQSSISTNTTIPTKYDVQEIETTTSEYDTETDDEDEEELETIIENPHKIIKQYEQRIQELEQSYDIERTLTINNNDIPIVVHVKPDIKSGFVELDQIKVKKLGLNKKR